MKIKERNREQMGKVMKNKTQWLESPVALVDEEHVDKSSYGSGYETLF